MEYLWLLMVGVLMVAWQAIWWIIAAYLLVGAVLMYRWHKEDTKTFGIKPTWLEFIAVCSIIVPLWPIAVLTRRAC